MMKILCLVVLVGLVAVSQGYKLQRRGHGGRSGDGGGSIGLEVYDTEGIIDAIAEVKEKVTDIQTQMSDYQADRLTSPLTQENAVMFADDGRDLVKDIMETFKPLSRVTKKYEEFVDITSVETSCHNVALLWVDYVANGVPEVYDGEQVYDALTLDIDCLDAKLQLVLDIPDMVDPIVGEVNTNLFDLEQHMSDFLNNVKLVHQATKEISREEEAPIVERVLLAFFKKQFKRLTVNRK